jgi:integrase/recombinase XerD
MYAMQIILPYKEDFLLELLNNNYSKETVYNYNRDLFVFEVFLIIGKTNFVDVSKKTITLYKGFLRDGGYLKQINDFFVKYNKRAEDNPDLLLDESYTSEYDDLLHAFYHHRRNENGAALASRSVNRMLSALRSYCKYLIDFDHDCPIPPSAIKLIKTERRETQVAELSDLIRLIESPEEFELKEEVKLRNRAMLELLFSTGMRISELVNLNRSQLNSEGKIYVMGKGKKQRFVYLTERAKEHLDKYLKIRNDDNEALFIPYRGGRNGERNRRISTNYLQERIATYRKKLEIVVPTSAHSLRHGFATYLAEQGANPSAIQILLGHESLHTTSRYVHGSDKYAEETHKKFHPLQSD